MRILSLLPFHEIIFVLSSDKGNICPPPKRKYFKSFHVLSPLESIGFGENQNVLPGIVLMAARDFNFALN